MNKIGVYYAFLAKSDIVEWHDCLVRAKAAGAEILEASAPRLSVMTEHDRRAIADHARELGLSLTLATALAIEADISSMNEKTHRAGIDSLLRDVDLAVAIGARTIGGILTGPSKHFPKDIEYEREKFLENSVRGLSEVGKIASCANVTIAVEVANRFETPLVNTAAEALKVVEAINQPSVGIHLDTFHMNIEEDDPADAVRLAGKHLVHFHVCENNRKLPGQAHICWEAIFSALQEIEYDGNIVIESLPGPYGSIAARLNIWRALSNDIDRELAASIVFLKNLMGVRNEIR